MEFDEVIAPVLRILDSANGSFQTPYQLCMRLEESEPEIWRRLKDEYPAVPGANPMGAGAGVHYSPASFVALALDHAHKRDSNIKKEWFVCKGVTFGGIGAGDTAEVISIWATKE